MTNSSESRFPANPPKEKLRENYDAMRSALISVNISRGIFRSQSEKRGVVIAELQRELQADLGNEARAKARLHAMNSRLVQVIRELEATGDAIAEAVEESEQQSGFWLVRMFQKLVQLARQWRSVKAKAAAIASEARPTEPEALTHGYPVDRRSPRGHQPRTGRYGCMRVPMGRRGTHATHRSGDRGAAKPTSANRHSPPPLGSWGWAALNSKPGPPPRACANNTRSRATAN